MARYKPSCLDVVLGKHSEEPPNTDCPGEKAFIQVRSVPLRLRNIIYLSRCRSSSSPRHKTQAIRQLHPKPSIVSVWYLQDTLYGIVSCDLLPRMEGCSGPILTISTEIQQSASAFRKYRFLYILPIGTHSSLPLLHWVLLQTRGKQ